MRDKDFRDELMNAIVEVAQEKGLSVNQCIYGSGKNVKAANERALQKTIKKSNV